MVVERSDFSVATYSVASSSGDRPGVDELDRRRRQAPAGPARPAGRRTPPPQAARNDSETNVAAIAAR